MIRKGIHRKPKNYENKHKIGSSTKVIITTCLVNPYHKMVMTS